MTLSIDSNSRKTYRRCADHSRTDFISDVIKTPQSAKLTAAGRADIIRCVGVVLLDICRLERNSLS